MDETELFCIGNALVDVFAQADEKLCDSYGITTPVQHIEMEELTSILSALPEYITVSGGGAANTAKVAGFLGARACFTGAIGRKNTPDNFGRIFEKDLAASSVKLNLKIKPLPTGICLILKTGENKTRIAAAPSAAMELSEDDINEEDVKKTKLVVVDGYMLWRPGFVRHILNLADKYGKPAAIDLGSPGIAREKAADVEEYARKYPLILFMNEEEADAFYIGLYRGLQGIKPLDQFFRSFTTGNSWPIIAVKLGSLGAICFSGGEMHQNGTKAINALETTGAGDAFSAGFLTAWVRNKPLPECAAMGNKAAALVLGAEGSQMENSGPVEPLFSE